MEFKATQAPSWLQSQIEINRWLISIGLPPQKFPELLLRDERDWQRERDERDAAQAAIKEANRAAHFERVREQHAALTPEERKLKRLARKMKRLNGKVKRRSKCL